MDREPKKPGNYLSIDGGPSGLPALYTLDEMFNRLQDDLKSDKELVPRRWFDIIIGTGRGAIIAILLGKLGMTVSEAIEAYMKLEPILSAKPAQNDEEREKNREKFKRVFMEILSEANVKEDAPMLDETGTKTAICVASMVNVSTVQLIRSYPIRGTRAAPCTILEAACACVAFPDQFLPVVIGTGHKKMMLVDAVAGYANPTKELLKEAQKIFGEEAEVATILSIGAGRWNVQITNSHGRGVHLDEALKRGAIGSEQVHEDLHGRLLQTAIYFRLNVERELDNEPEAILTHISAYVGGAGTSSRLDAAIRRIQTRPSGNNLTEINSVTAVEIKLKPRPRLVSNFVGREDILEAMRHAHIDNQPSRRQEPVITILSGIGGLGKTQTALKSALEFEERYPGVLVCFLDASSPETLKADLETVIRSCGTVYHSKSHEDALVWLATELSNWLVIFDNADDPDMDPALYIPRCSHGHVIITTRNATLTTLAPNNTHALEGLPTSDATTLLLTASKYPNGEENRGLAEKIALELGCLPLALAHAAGYIHVHRCLGEYLDMYHKNKEKILASTNSRLLHEYRSSVAMTIEMSISKLTGRARDILHLFSYMSATSIPLSVIAKAAERRFQNVEWSEESSLTPETLKQADALMKIFCPDGEWSEFDFNEPIRECLQYSLLQLTIQSDEKFYSMHILVQSYLQRTDLIHDHQPRRLICRLLGSAVTIGSRYEFLAFDRILLPHIRLVQIEDVTEAGDHYGLGYVLNEVGDTKLAIVHREKCVEIWRELLGKEDGHTVSAMLNLSISYKKAGKNQAALELRQQVLSIRQRLLGPEHQDTVRAMGSLASSYRNLGKYQAALELEEKVLSLQRKLLGPQHPDTVITMGNLAASHYKLGNYQTALKLDEEVLSLRKTQFGSEHPVTLRAMKNLAISYKRIGRNQVALELEEECLSLYSRLLGQHHQSTLKAMWNLSITYNKLNMQAQRLDLLRTSVPAYEAAESYGPNHSDTIRLRNDLNTLSARIAHEND